MSDLSSSCKKVYTLKGLDREDLNLIISGLNRIGGDLEQHDRNKTLDLLEVLK